MNERALRLEIVSAAQQLATARLTPGTSGNVSARLPDGMLLTPSAVPYGALEPDGLVAMRLDGTVRDTAAPARPSVEWRLHAEIYRARADLHAVVHAHPPHATALACVRQDLPAFHYMVAAAGGGSIRCAPYASPGSEALARHAVRTLDERTACLLANHGIVACGPTPAAALELAAHVEALAQQYLLARLAGEPVLLDDAEMERLVEHVTRYRAEPPVP